MSYIYAWTDTCEPEYPADENRDLAEERYWRAYCQPCGTSPCTWDGTPDGFHTDKPPLLPDPAGHAHDGGCTWAGCGFPEPPDTLREMREPE